MDLSSFVRILREAGYIPYESSARSRSGIIYLMAAKQGTKYLLLSGDDADFSGSRLEHRGVSFLLCPLSHQNCQALRKKFPYTVPVSLHGKAVTFGLGDRLGLCTGAHIKALKGTNVFPVLAQQSMRELTLTGRSSQSMLDDVAWQIFEAGYEGGYAADGDHLKSLDEVRSALSDGMTMITLDCSEYIRNDISALTPAAAWNECRAQFPARDLARYQNTYCGKTFLLKDGTSVAFPKDTFPYLVLTYGKSLPFIKDVYTQAILRSPRRISFEVSIDETDGTTSPEAHYFIAAEMEAMNVKADSVAPRFCGDFQKGIDYIGDTDQFQKELAVHASIAETFGYRISIHSGSDKFRVFPYIGTLGRFHLKTSGTSWVEALRVAAISNPALFRRMAAFARQSFEAARQYYHVTASLENLPNLEIVQDTQLPDLMDMPDFRQVMHITYGFLLQAKDSQGNDVFRKELYQTLDQHRDILDEVIAKHIFRHLEKLGAATVTG